MLAATNGKPRGHPGPKDGLLTVGYDTLKFTISKTPLLAEPLPGSCMPPPPPQALNFVSQAPGTVTRVLPTSRPPTPKSV